MKICISAPTGYNTREILLPLQPLLDSDESITQVQVISPAAAWRQELFPTFGSKFIFHTNPTDAAGHEALFRTIKPDVIATPTVGLDANDLPIIRAGKKLSIPTVTFIASWDNVFKMERQRKRDLAIPHYIAVWNQMNFDHVLESFGEHITPDRMSITGPPRFDYFTHTDQIPAKDEVLRYIGFNNPSPGAVLLHCATTELYPFEYIIKTIAAAKTKKYLPFQALIYASVHPGGNLKNHEHCQQYGAHVKYSFGRRDTSPHKDFQYLPTNEEMYLLVSLFKHTSVLINQSSTVAIESMVADVPVINIKYGQPLDWLRWYRSPVYRDFRQHYRYITDEGGTTLVRNAQQLIRAINAYCEHPMLHHTQRQRTVKKMITYTDGRNSERLLNFIKQCAV